MKPVDPIKIAIVGKGGMGRLFGQTLSDGNRSIDYFGRDISSEELQHHEVIVIATPTSAAKDINSLLRKVPGLDGKLVICLWSYMNAGVKTFDNKVPIVYLHLLFGPDIEEIAGQNVVIAGQHDHKLFVPIRQTLQKKGAEIHITDDKSHDKIMAYTQSLSQLSSLLLGMSLARSGYSRKELHDYASLTFRLNRYTIERIMRQKADLWAELQFENEYYKPVLEQYISDLHQMAEAVRLQDHKSFKELFSKAATFWEESYYNNDTTKRNPNNGSNSSKKVGIVTLGPAGTYSQEAARLYAAGKPITLVSSIKEVLNMVVEGKAERGILPVENAIQGVVSETLDGLFTNELVIEDELVLDIHHSLCAIERPQQKDLIKTIYSHPQALGQCQDYLALNYPNASLVPAASTAAGMQKIAEQKDLQALAIGPRFASKIYNLTELEQNIEDNPGNQTRFVVFSKDLNTQKILPFILISALPKADRPGLLEEILAIIKLQGVNMSQIESRPDRTKLGSYMFYIRLDMPGNDERYAIIAAAAKKLGVDIRRLSA